MTTQDWSDILKFVEFKVYAYKQVIVDIGTDHDCLFQVERGRIREERYFVFLMSNFLFSIDFDFLQFFFFFFITDNWRMERFKSSDFTQLEIYLVKMDFWKLDLLKLDLLLIHLLRGFLFCLEKVQYFKLIRWHKDFSSIYVFKLHIDYIQIMNNFGIILNFFTFKLFVFVQSNSMFQISFGKLS